MHHIIYLSWATTPFTNAQLQRLLIDARRRNTALAITGILLYGNDCFVQVLEGEESTINRIYAQIRQDTRHGNVLTFANKPIEQRAFADWAMAFKSVTSQQFDDVVGHLGPTNAPVNTSGLAHADVFLFDLLRSFVLP